MTKASGGAGPGELPEWRWDVALSFAAAQRDYAEKVARALQTRGVRCFYDADEQIELWGTYLAEELPAIYGERAAAVVVFVSAQYAARDWTRLERRAALNRAVRERREYVLPARFDDTPLPGLLSDLVAVDLRGRTPEQFAALIAAKLAALDVTGPGLAGSPASDAGMARPPGAVRAGEADLRRLGVHAAISVPGVPDEVPPEYVPRDADAAEHGVRAKVAAATERGGFVLLVGGSSVGKTRCAAEAVRALLPEWWLVHPAGPAEVAALAAAPPLRTVLWLDELQRYLDGEHGLDGGVIRALLNASHPAVIIGTLWPDFYAVYTTLPASNGADPHAREREVLDLAAVVRISAAFSPAEQGRAHAAAARDRRLRVALESAEYGLTQTLAAAPQLVARWEDAQTASPYGWAMLTAALDAARLGAHAPLSAEFLRAAAPDYCTSQQQAGAPKKWFKKALAYATSTLNGAVSALSPVGVGIGSITGYTAADYLIQYAAWERRHTRVPASTWDAVVSHIRDPADTVRLADSASSRLLYRYAIPLYRHAAAAGDENAAFRLAELLAQRGDLDELRARADAGDGPAASRLAGLLTDRGDLDELRARADAGDGPAAFRLAWLLNDCGDLNQAEQILRAAADADGPAAFQLADLLTELLAERGDLDGLRAQADAGNWFAASRLANLLAQCGDLGELRARAAARDEHAVRELADLLTDRGDLNEAEQILRAQADADVEYAAREYAVRELADLLTDRGDLNEAEQILRAAADADGLAARRLADLLAENGDLDGLRARAGAGDHEAASRLAGLLTDRGDLDELRARAGAGDHEAASRLAGLLAQRGDLDGLRARAAAGDRPAASRLAGLLTDRGDLDEAEQILRALADAGDEYAARQLPGLLIKQGQGEEAERLRRFGFNPDGSIACA